MTSWRDVRAERVVDARFVDGPNAGIDWLVPSTPNGTPPPVIRLNDALDPDPAGLIVYELVDLGAHDTGRYRLRAPAAPDHGVVETSPGSPTDS